MGPVELILRESGRPEAKIEATVVGDTRLQAELTAAQLGLDLSQAEIILPRGIAGRNGLSATLWASADDRVHFSSGVSVG